VGWLGGYGGSPEEAGEFAGDGDGGEVAGFAAFAQTLVEPVEAALGAQGASLPASGVRS